MIIHPAEVADKLSGRKSVSDLQSDRDWVCAFDQAILGTYVSSTALEESGKPPPISEVAWVVASVDGENDEEHWLGIFRMKNGKYIKLTAGCDYTGWDCQAGGSFDEFDTVEAACSKLSLDAEERTRLESQLRGRIDLDW